MQRIAGLQTCLYGSSVIVHGGAHRDTLYHLDLLTLQWHADACGGALPPAALYHGAAVYDRFLYVCGGLTLSEVSEQEGVPRPTRSIQYKSMRRLTMYRLDLAQLEWSLVDCDGLVPTDRSHHAVAVAGHQLVLFGGKPIGPAFTQRQMKQLDGVSFYDPFVLDLKTHCWRRIELPSDCLLPRLWGHSLNVMDTSTVVLFGGFEVGLEDSVSADSSPDGDNLPFAELSTNVFVLNLEIPSCIIFAPRTDDIAPAPRALHSAVMRGRSELLVFGGLVVETTLLQPTMTSSLEMWSWAPLNGTWRPVPFCFDEVHHKPPSPHPYSKFSAAAYGETVVVLPPDLLSVHLFDGRRWNTMTCDASALDAAETTSPYHRDNLFDAKEPTTHREKSVLSETENEEIRALKSEVESLRERVRDVAQHASPQPRSAGATTRSLDDISQRIRGSSYGMSPAIEDYFLELKPKSMNDPSSAVIAASSRSVAAPPVPITPSTLESFLERDRSQLKKKLASSIATWS